MKRSLNTLALLLALLMLLSACADKAPKEDGTQPSEGSSREATENSENRENTGADTPSQSEAQENDPEQGNAADPTDASVQDSTGGQSSTHGQPDVQTPEDGNTYEEYLSALSLFALSMEYPDFQLQEIYSASSVSLANKADSKGIYVFFDSMGQTLCAHVSPLAAERNESGSLDLFANETGYAAFELQAQLPATEGLTFLDPQIYGPLLSELSGVAFYNH